MTSAFEAFLWLLPVVGLLGVFALAGALRGSAQRMTLAVGPFLVGWAMVSASPLLAASHGAGNYLAALAAMALYGIGYLAIAVHYVVLLVAAIGMWLRRNERERNEALGDGEQTLAPVEDVANMTPEQLGKAMAARFKG